MLFLIGTLILCVGMGTVALVVMSQQEDDIDFETLLRRWAGKRGYTGSLQPLLISLAISYAAAVIVLRIIGASTPVGLVTALPISVAIGWVLAGRVAASKGRRFNQQFRTALAQIGAQLESGAGPISAVEAVARTSSNPLQSELLVVVNQAKSGKPLHKAFLPTSERYPSRAMELIIAAFSIEATRGGKLQPALVEAGRILESNSALEQEAMADIAQIRNQFWIVLLIISVVCLWLLEGGGIGAESILTTPAGVIGVSVGVANVGVGIIRMLRLLSKMGAN